MNKIARGRFKRTPLDVFFALFLLTAVVGVWAAYDREAAWEKFWLIASAILIYYALASQPRERAWMAAGVFGLFGATLSGYFLLAYDWQASPAKIGIVNRLALLWMSARPPFPAGKLDPDIVGGVVALLIPPLVAAGWYAWTGGRRRLAALAVIAGAVAMFGLFLTAQRGAWLGLGLAFALWLVWLASGYASQYRRAVFTVALGLLSGGAAIAALAFPDLALKVAAPGNRLETAQQTLLLATDFPFSGGGLGSFPGLFSRYILVIPWLFMPHSSNLFLDTLVEQGVPGPMALAGIFAGSFWLLATRPRMDEYWRWAVASGLIVMTVYGLVEDPFYSGWPVLLLFVFPGLGVAVSEPETSSERRPLGGRWKIAVGAGVLVAATGMFVAFRQQVLAAWYANWGAAEMARVELAGWPERARWQSDFDPAEFAPAERLFNQSLQLAPNNLTANYRLGLIAAKQGHETEAVSRWSQANQAAPSHRGVRKVLGYAYVWQGQLDQAAELLSDIPEARNEMDTYSWWWGTQGRDDLAAQAAAMAKRLP